MFGDAKVGDRVWDYERNCWGTIVNINKECHYPLKVRLDNKLSEELYYTIDGKSTIRNVNPSLFWDKIKINIPKKPFDLENELRKLEIKEFKTKQDNRTLSWDNLSKKIYTTTYNITETPMIKYFAEESIDKFINNIKNKNITKEEFFSAYKKVFG